MLVILVIEWWYVFSYSLSSSSSNSTIQVWNGRCFERTSLSSLGLVLQLGHDGATCPRATVTTGITVVDITGVHAMTVRYCECGAPPLPRYQQLLQAGFFPATEKRCTTAVSLGFLNAYHKLAQTAKTNLYDFYMFVLLRSDPLGLHHSVVRTGSCSLLIRRDSYDAKHALMGPVSLVVRMYKDILALKRGGRGHDETGAAGTKPGELAILCPACPCPGYNLPDNWADLAVIFP
jgi:hypothetical protein